MIVCGTDFSQHAGAACRAAAALARQLRLPLTLVHVADADAPAAPDGGAQPSLLQERSAALQAEFGISVTPRFERGAVDTTLVALARSLDARLLVVAALDERKQHQWLVGSVAERVAQASPAPTLVVRDGASLEAWASGARTLRVLVGVELTATSRPALRWASGLRSVNVRELLVAQVVRPADEHQRHGITGSIPLDHLRPELEPVLLAELEQWAGADAGDGAKYIVQPGWGRTDSHLTLLAADSKADLLVVGTHRKAGIARLWQGSVSRGVLHGAAMSVACIPPGWSTATGAATDADA